MLRDHERDDHWLYARCSTYEQDLTAQRQRLAELGVAAERIYLDHGLTGTHPRTARPRSGTRRGATGRHARGTQGLARRGTKQELRPVPKRSAMSVRSGDGTEARAAKPIATCSAWQCVPAPHVVPRCRVAT